MKHICPGCKASLPVSQNKMLTCEWCRLKLMNPLYEEKPTLTHHSTSKISAKISDNFDEIYDNMNSKSLNNNQQNFNTVAHEINSELGKPKNKVVALLLAIFVGFLGAHKFYEGKFILGIIYLFTYGLFGIGIVIDVIVLIFKPTTYYIKPKNR